MNKQKDLTELVHRLVVAAEPDLVAVVLYGSAADHEFEEAHSDLNILCLLSSTGAAVLQKLRPVGFWWSKQGHPAPLVFTLPELRECADIFAIELLDMKSRHRMLLGDDFLADFDVPMDLHRHQVERELRNSVVRLRRSYLQLRGRADELADLMIASSSTFAALFRHALIALGEPAPESRREATAHLAQRIGFDPSGVQAVFDLREGKRARRDFDLEATFATYLDAVSRAAEEMDRRLAAL